MADAMKLLPCPFCGEQPIMADNRQTGGACFVQCQTCDAETAGTTTQDEAADLWNRRASPPAREEAPDEGAGEPPRPDCPHAEPFRFCQSCKVSPCPIGLGGKA